MLQQNAPTHKPQHTSTLTLPLAQTLRDHLSALIRFPTLSSNQTANAEAIDWVETQLANLPLYITRYSQEDFPSLVATTRRTKTPRLWLAGHMDVVAARPEAFEPEVKDGKLYGRGAHDMKSALAVFIVLLQTLGDALPDYDLGFMVTSDEEISGHRGTKWLLDSVGYGGEVAIIPDSGASWTIEMGAKGLSWWEVTATGRAAHAGRLWEGDNAIDKIMQFVNHVRANTPTEPCDVEDHQHTTVNLATLNSGTSINQVPETASAHLDIRFIADQTIETIQGWMDEATAAIPGTSVTLLSAGPSYQVRHIEPVEAFRHIVQEVTGHQATLALSHGTSDAKYFAFHDIATINISPTGSGFHVPDEWVDLQSLAEFYEVVRRFAEKYAR